MSKKKLVYPYEGYSSSGSDADYSGSKPIIKSEDYVDLYGELATIMFDKHIGDMYSDTPYEIDEDNGNWITKEKYEDIWCETVDKVCEILDFHLERKG